MPSFSLSFKDVRKEDVAQAGGKGASLGEMASAGFPVPPGFVILSDSFKQFIKENNIVAEIEAVLETVDIRETHTVEFASEKIQALILDGKIPDVIASDIKKAFKRLGAQFVAVRSSATSEDSASAAWAGQLDTFLNVTEKGLLESVRKCWASLYTPRAIFYRFEKELHKEDVSVAVVVQKMIQSESAGIAFSVHPVTEDPDQLIIEAGYGLGEAVVSGQVTPDSYVVHKKSLKFLEKNVSGQSKGLFRKKDGGNEWKELGDAGKTQVLTDSEIIELSKIIIRIENHYGFPCDIEWAREGGKFYITQSRPITTLTNKDAADKGIIVLLKPKEIESNLLGLIKKTDWYADWSGPFPLIEVSTSNNIYFAALQENFGKSFHHYLVTYHDGISSARLPQDELQEFGRYLSKKLEDPRYAKTFADNFKKAADAVNKILELKPSEFLKRLKTFKEPYKRYGAYNVATKIAFNYLPKDALKTRSLLEEARKYSETFYKDNAEMYAKATDLLASEMKYPKKLILMMTASEIYDYQENKRLPEKADLERRYSCLGLYFEDEETYFLNESQLEKIEQSWVEKSEIKQLQGTAAYPGRVVGPCKIILNYQHATMNEGDILVTGMTDPNFLPLMKKAGAIVTNGGGMLSHAAIVARELKKPCVIGTKHATKILKDGDLVEVDADLGVVRIMNQSIGQSQFRTFTREHAREYSLFRIAAWYNAVSQKMADITGVSVDEACAIYKGKDLVDVYYYPDALKKIIPSIAKDCQDKEAMIGKIQDFLNRFERLKQYFIGKKKIKNLAQLREFQEEYAFVWAWIGVIFIIPSLPVDEELKKLAYEARSKTQEYNETPEAVFKEFMEKTFPKLKGKTRFVSPEEIWSGEIKTKSIVPKIKERSKGFIFYKSQIYVGDQSHILPELGICLEEGESVISGKAEATGNEIKGQLVQKGKAKGIVKVISSIKDIPKVRQGDILVASMTMPKYLPAMKKAAAFVTDEGGITCHAAIIAREMKKPCIIGTKVATRVLKDGDVVEVDADKGIVKVISAGKVILSPIYTRDKSLLYFQMWDESDRKGYEKYLCHKVRHNLFLKPSSGRKTTVYYEQKELDEIDSILKKKVDKPGFLKAICKDLEAVWSVIEPYAKGKKKIGSEKEFKKYYSALVDFWAALNTPYTLPKLDVDKKSKDFILKYRGQTEKYTAKMGNLLHEFVEKEFPSAKKYSKLVTVEEVGKLGKADTLDVIKSRENGFGLYNGKILSLEETREVLEKEGVSFEKHETTGTELKGTCAWKGKANGRARLILTDADLKRLHEGDVLVTEMTSPEYVPYMKMASAIVTDEGGVTCHAAIVARELKKPCIIGTKVATKVLKDGDLVEIDADNGIVRIITGQPDDLAIEEFTIPRSRPCALSPVYWNAVLQTSEDVKRLYGETLSYEYNTFKNGMMNTIVPKKEWDALGDIISDKMIWKEGYFENLDKRTSAAKKRILGFLEKNKEADLKKESFESLVATASQIKSLFLEYDAASVFSWFVAGDQFKRKAGIFLKVSPDELDVLSHPSESTYATMMDLDTMRAAVEGKEKEATKALAERYYWMPFGYDGPTTWDEQHFASQISAYKEKINESKSKLEEMKTHEATLKRSEKEIILKHRFGKKETALIGKLKKIAVWTDERKMLDFQLFHKYGLVLCEIGSRTGLPETQLKYLFTEELEGLKARKEELSARSQDRMRSEFMIITKQGKTRVATESELQKVKDAISSHLQSDGGLIQGTVACKGTASHYTARVKILHSSRDCQKVQEGEFLVASMTTPDFVPAMKRAIGFITDEGGVTCHAAIVSREMKKPCIIGTKIATKALKDGDLVEVDAGTGVVRRIRDAADENLLDVFLKDFGKDTYYPLVPVNFFAAGAPGFSPDFGNRGFPFSFLVVMKNGSGFVLMSDVEFKIESEKMFSSYMKNPSALKKRLSELDAIERRFDKDYARMSISSIRKMSSSQAAEGMKEVVSGSRSYNAKGIFSLFFDKELCLEFIRKRGLKISERSIARIWDRAVDPVEWSFDKRKRQDILKMISDNMNLKEIAEKMQYTFAGYLRVFSDDEVESAIQTEYAGFLKNPRLAAEELKQERKAYLAKKKRHESWRKTLSEEERRLADYMQFIIWLRDKRKDLHGKGMVAEYRVAEKLLKEAGIPKDYRYYIAYEEYALGADYLASKKDEIMRRPSGTIMLCRMDGDVRFQYDDYEETVERIKKIKECSETHDEGISGNTAYPGKVRGTAKVILRREDYDMFKQGDILFTSMTRPEYVPLMKKAAAIVTDEGGITCHAAIVSREMKKPCIIGTKNASFKVKDGDLVEVDADAGTVQVIRASVPENWLRVVSFRTELLTEHIIHEGYRTSIQKLFPFLPPFRNRMILDNDIFIDLSENEKLREFISKDFFVSEKIFDKIESLSKKLMGLSKDIEMTDYSKTGIAKIKADWSSFYDLFRDTSGLIGIPTIIDLALEARLKEMLSGLKLSVDEAYAVFSVSSEAISTMRAREELLSLAGSDFSGKRLEGRIVLYLQKYGWLRSTLLDITEYSSDDVLREIEEIKDPSRELASLRKTRAANDAAARKIIDSFPLELKKLSLLMRRVIYFRTARLEWMNEACYRARNLLDEIAKRLRISRHELVYLRPQEIAESLDEGLLVQKEEIKERMKAYGYVSDNKHERLLLLKEDLREWKDRFQESASGELRGIPACKGSAKGIVALVKDRSELGKVREGDILVAPLTTPDFLVAMKKASAIVTELGGLTSHAAIVARELSKPCIVGIKGVTSSLKDGDLVEVDADLGVVRKLEPSELLIDDYIRQMHRIEMSAPVPNCSVLVQSSGWNTKKYFGKYYDDEQDFPLFAAMKQGEGFLGWSLGKAKRINAEIFRRYWRDPAILAKILDDLRMLEHRIDESYMRMTYRYVTAGPEDRILSEALDALDAAWDLNALVFFSVYFDKELCRSYVEGHGIRVRDFDNFWERAVQPVFLSFDKRRYLHFLKTLKRTKDWDVIGEQCQFLEAHYDHVKTVREVALILKEKHKGIRDAAAEIKRIEREQRMQDKGCQSWMRGLNVDERKLAAFIQAAMELRDIRKDSIAKAVALVFKAAQKVCKKSGVEDSLAFFMTVGELRKGSDYLEKNKEEIRERTGGFTSLVNYDGTIAFRREDYDRTKEKAYAFYNGQHLAGVDRGLIRGQTGSPGKAKGTVRKIYTVASEGKNFRQGEILVTGMTRPEYVPLMKKAAAVVTDEGGITCHAAIVSRELRIPCVIGTKIATHSLKDGDLVEVDADKGVVKIIFAARAPDKMRVVVTRKYVPLLTDFFLSSYADTSNYVKLYGHEYFMRTAYIDGPFYYGRDAAEFGDFMMGHEAKAPGTVMRSLERIYAQGDWLIRLAKKIRSSDYSRTDMKRLISDFRRFAKEYVLFGISLAGYNIQLPVEKHLRKVLIKRGIDEGELGLLTFPLKENFAALEAKNLLRIGSVIQDKGEFSDLSRAEQKMLAEHVEEYGWINARGGLADPWTENEIFDRIKEVKGSCAEKLSESEAHRKDEMWRSDALLKRLDLDQKLRAMVAIARELVYFRTYRTDCLNQAVPLIRNLLEAIAKKRSISYEDLLHLRVDEILEEEEVSREEISRRKNGYAEMCLKPGELRFTSDPEEMESWQKEYCEEDGHDSTEIKGTPANKGSVKGIVHIVMTKQDIHKVREGDVLVAPMTTPNMVSAMEKAAAFVTDEGGITCHAAIIAREMKKPCIIGTKNATKILKDGDLVEVDADTGEVKIIRRA